jgi:uncharacterized protein DUF2510
MGTLLALVPEVAVSKGLLIGEVVIVVVLVALMVAIIVLNRRRKSEKKPAQAPTPQSYYADLQDSPPAQAAGTAPDPLSMASPVPVAQGAAAVGTPPPAAAPPPAPPAAGSPPPGTPAGWLPEPSGAPDTLRYWDGNTWTQHVAKRS